MGGLLLGVDADFRCLSVQPQFPADNVRQVLTMSEFCGNRIELEFKTKCVVLVRCLEMSMFIFNRSVRPRAGSIVYV